MSHPLGATRPTMDAPLTLGDWPASGGHDVASLSLFPDEVPLVDRWPLIGLTADYLGAWLDHRCELDLAGREGFTSAANELLENAFKYRHPTDPDPIRVRLAVARHGVVLCVSNPVCHEQGLCLIRAVTRLRSEDHTRLFLQSVECGSPDQCGLGFWSIVQQPGVKLGWRLADSGVGGDTWGLETRLQLMPLNA